MTDAPTYEAVEIAGARYAALPLGFLLGRRNPKNPRKISTAGLDRLSSYLEKWGVVDAPVWNERSGQLVGGHQRVEALYMDEADLEVPIPVRLVDLSDDDEAALNVALNDRRAQGEWEGLVEFLDQIHDLEARTVLDADELIAENLYPAGTVPVGEDPMSGRTLYRCPKCSHEWEGSPRPA